MIPLIYWIPDAEFEHNFRSPWQRLEAEATSPEEDLLHVGIVGCGEFKPAESHHPENKQKSNEQGLRNSTLSTNKEFQSREHRLPFKRCSWSLTPRTLSWCRDPCLSRSPLAQTLEVKP